MRNVMDCVLVILLVLIGLAWMFVGAVFGLGKRHGQFLVRGKYWLLDVLAGRVRVNYRELAIGLGGAAGIGLIMFRHDFWGSLVALTVQPLWVIDMWRERAWGKFALAVYFTAAYLFGAVRALGGV